MFIKLDVDVRAVYIARQSFLKLLLYPAHPKLIFLCSLFYIWVHFGHWLSQSFLQYTVKVELIRELDSEINPAFAISLMNVQ